MDTKDLFEEIAKLAYEYYEKSGYVHGYDYEHWIEAERVIIERFNAGREEGVKKKTSPKKTTTKKTTAKKTTTKKPAGKQTVKAVKKATKA